MQNKNRIYSDLASDSFDFPLFRVGVFACAYRGHWSTLGFISFPLPCRFWRLSSSGLTTSTLNCWAISLAGFFFFYVPESNVGYHVTLVSCVVSSFQSMAVFQSFLIVPDFYTSYSIECPSLYIWVSGVFLCGGWHCAFLTKATEVMCPSHNIREVKWCH